MKRVTLSYEYSYDTRMTRVSYVKIYASGTLRLRIAICTKSWFTKAFTYIYVPDSQRTELRRDMYITIETIVFWSIRMYFGGAHFWLSNNISCVFIAARNRGIITVRLVKLISWY